MYQVVVIIMENIKQGKEIENNGKLIYIDYSWKLFWEVIIWTETRMN